MGGQEQLAGRLCAGLAEKNPYKRSLYITCGKQTMRFLRHLGRLLKDFLGFAWQNKAWWIIPIVLVLLLLSFLIFAGSSAAPAFIYTLF